MIEIVTCGCIIVFKLLVSDIAQSAGAAEYIDCISADSLQLVSWIWH